MGAYVFRLSSPSKQVTATLGEKVVSLGLIQYAYKPTQVNNKTNLRWHQQYVTLPCAAWKERTMPPYVVAVFGPDDAERTPKDGNPVLRWSPGRKCVTDDPDWDGRHIGTLRITQDAAGAPQYRIELRKDAP